MTDFDALLIAMQSDHQTQQLKRVNQEARQSYENMQKIIQSKVGMRFTPDSAEFINIIAKNRGYDQLVINMRTMIEGYIGSIGEQHREVRGKIEAFLKAMQALIVESRHIAEPLSPGDKAQAGVGASISAAPESKGQNGTGHNGAGGGAPPTAPLRDPSRVPSLNFAVQPNGAANLPQSFQSVVLPDQQQLVDRVAQFTQQLAAIQGSLAAVQQDSKQFGGWTSDIMTKLVTKESFDRLNYQYSALDDKYQQLRKSIADQLIQTMVNLSTQLGIDLSNADQRSSASINQEVLNSSVRTMTASLERILRNASELEPIPVVLYMLFDERIMEKSGQSEPASDPQLTNCVAQIVARGFWRRVGQYYVVDRPAKVITFSQGRGR